MSERTVRDVDSDIGCVVFMTFFVMLVCFFLFQRQAKRAIERCSERGGVAIWAPFVGWDCAAKQPQK